MPRLVGGGGRRGERSNATAKSALHLRGSITLTECHLLPATKV